MMTKEVLIDRENDVLSQADEVLQYAKKNFQLKDLFHGVLSCKLIEQAATDRGIMVTEPEIRAEVDRWRHENRFQKAADAMAWLEAQKISVADLEAAMGDRLRRTKLSRTLFEAVAERYFRQNKRGFDQFSLYQIKVADQFLAKELFFQIEEQEISFFEAAHAYNLDPARRKNCGYEGRCYRRILRPEVSAYVFNALPGTLLAPLAIEQGYALFYIDEFIPAQLTPELHQTLIEALFQNWLNQELSTSV
jgi:parvulin-like peptidyl-prolyl isomerase